MICFNQKLEQDVMSCYRNTLKSSVCVVPSVYPSCPAQSLVVEPNCVAAPKREILLKAK